MLTTHGCTARCRHCSANSAPERTEALEAAPLTRILGEAFDELELRVVAFAGGEPLLLGDELLAAIRTCRASGVPSRVITNGYWATSLSAARKTVERLREAGLDELNISTDDYHLPFVSLQRVRYAFEAAIAAGFRSVTILNTYGPRSWLTPELLAREFGAGRDLTLRLGEDGLADHVGKARETSLMLSNRPLLRLGRGLSGLSEADLDRDAARHLAADAEAIGGCPMAVRSAAISPQGHLVACCGIEAEGNDILDYGDLAEHSLADLLDRADRDVPTNMIAILGPPKIKELLEAIAPDEIDFPRERYHSYCDVCEDLVGIEANRRAVHRHQAKFVDAVLMVRQAYEERFSDENGRVRIPPGANLPLTFTPTTDV